MSIIVVGADNPYHQDVFEELLRNEVEIAYYISHYQIKDNLRLKNIPRIDASAFYSCEDILQDVDATDGSDLDSNYFEWMSECERYFMITTDRLSASPKSVKFRRIIFMRILLYFKNIFEISKNISHVFFPATPHFGWDIILFYTAKFYKVEPLILQRTDFSSKYFIRNDWRNFPGLTSSFDAKRISDEINFLNFDEKSDFSQYSLKINEKVKRGLNDRISKSGCVSDFFLKTWRKVRLVKSLWRRRRDKWTDSALFYNQNIFFVQKLSLYLKRFIENKRLIDVYEELSIAPDLSRPFIYFSMHFQPERSSQPEGLYYEDQYLAILMLAKALPPFWKLYIKEHPRQFDIWPPDLKKMHSRSEGMYREISKLKNVSLVKISIESQLLINSSKLVSTITGSAGWEALKAGKCAITFGYPWYSECKGCFIASSVEHIRASITAAGHYSTNQILGEVQQFVGNISSKLFMAFPGKHIASNDLYDEHVVSLTSAIMKKLHEPALNE